MLTAPTPDAQEARDNASFDAVLWALSRPGLIRTLPAPGPTPMVDALLDRECAAYATDPDLRAQISRCGAALVDLPRADHVFFDAAPTPEQLRQVACGSDLYPDDGATVICRATLGQGARLRLIGPGVDGALELQLDLPPALWAARAAAARYPMGFDLLVIDQDRLLGLPRSTQIEVL